MIASVSSAGHEYDRAIEAYNGARFEDALDLFGQVADKKGSHSVRGALARFYIGQCQYNLGLINLFDNQLTEAVNHFTQAKEIFHDDVSLSYYLTVALSGVGRHREAMEEMESKADSKIGLKMKTTLALACLNAGQPDRACQELAPLVEANPGFPDLRHLYALSLSRVSRWPEAVEHAEAAAKVSPRYRDDSESINRFAQQAGLGRNFVVEPGDWEDWNSLMSRILDIRPNLYELLPRLQESRNIGLLVAMRGILEREVADNPDWPDLRFYLSLVLERSGEKERAAAELETALNLNPDYTAAAEALARLRD